MALKDVVYTGAGRPKSTIFGHDAAHCVEDVTFENLRIGGELVTDPKQGGFEINAHTKDVRFVNR